MTATSTAGRGPLAPPHGCDLHGSPQRGAALVVKRAFDVVAAAILLALTAPILLVAAVAVRATSPGPALHRGVRVGRFGQRFTVYKLRSMVLDADPTVHEAYVHSLSCGHPADDHGLYKLVEDPRVTPLGRWLRRTSLDELPQLLNVLKGDMSLVGPRPECEYDLADYEAWQWRRFSVLPGMTGLWQVSGRGLLPPSEMLRLDVQYADTWSLRQDLAILLRTVPAVLSERGSA